MNIIILFLTFSLSFNALAYTEENQNLKKQFKSPEVWPAFVLENSPMSDVKLAAGYGNHIAIRLLAESHRYGINGLHKDYALSLSLYNRLIGTKSETEGYLGLANLYANGLGVPKDKKQANNYFDKAITSLRSNANENEKDLIHLYLYAFAEYIFGDASRFQYDAYKASRGDNERIYRIHEGYILLLRRHGEPEETKTNRFINLTNSELSNVHKQIKYWTDIGIKFDSFEVTFRYALSLLKGFAPYKRDVISGINLFKNMAKKCAIMESYGYEKQITAAALQLAIHYGENGDDPNFVEAYFWYLILEHIRDPNKEHWHLLAKGLEKYLTASQIASAKERKNRWIDTYCN